MQKSRFELTNQAIVKGAVAAAIFAIGVASWLTVHNGEHQRNSSGASPPDLEAEINGDEGMLTPFAGLLDTAEAMPAAVEQVVEVRRGDTLMGLLTDAGVDRGDAHQAIMALADLYSPRRLQPGQAIRLTFDPHLTATHAEGRLIAIGLQPDVERDIEVTRAPDGGFIATAVDRTLVREVAGAAGVIHSSLFEATLAAEVPMPVVIQAIHTFSFEVDFQRDIHPGDEFVLLFETYSDEAGLFAKAGPVLYANLILSAKPHEFYRFTTKDGHTDYYNSQGESVRRALMRTPINGARLSSGFGMRRHPVLGYSRMHRGVDFAAPTGTPVYAAGNGVVSRAGRWGAYGNYVRIRHNSTYQTAYAHLRGFAKGIRSGARVEQGQVIGYVGTTGRSTGPHLHYEVLVNGAQANPQKLDLPTGRKLEGTELAKFQERRARINQARDAILKAPRIARMGCSEQVTEEGSAAAAPDNC